MNVHRTDRETIFIDALNNDIEEMKTCAKSASTDIHKQTKFCLSKCYFLHENRIRLLKRQVQLDFL